MKKSDLGVLVEDPAVLWLREKGHIRNLGPKIYRILIELEDPNMFTFASRSFSEMAYMVGVGDPSFGQLQDWLKSHGLEFGMEFSDEIKKHFSKDADPTGFPHP
jgi:hypothetical protein